MSSTGDPRTPEEAITLLQTYFVRWVDQAIQEAQISVFEDNAKKTSKQLSSGIT